MSLRRRFGIARSCASAAVSEAGDVADEDLVGTGRSVYGSRGESFPTRLMVPETRNAPSFEARQTRSSPRLVPGGCFVGRVVSSCSRARRRW